MFHMPSRIGRYEIKTLIGAGGMGSLYLARDTNPNTARLVVVKLLLANLDSGDLRERFAREARALAALNHPNIVDIYDSGEFQGSPYIVMEYIRGETLAEKIKRRAPLTLAQKMRLMVELCSGLQHAHEAGIVHRDIKPANLMVDLHGRLKVLDFGIARVSEGLTRAAVQVTQINMRIGTPGYMSPEQIEGGDIDARSDVFAVGTVCYELLSYREAFTGTSTRQIENKVLQTDPPPLCSVVPDLDPEVEQIVARAMAKSPADRFQDATALEQAFERVRWRLGPETPMPAPRAVTPLPLTNPNRKSRDSRADAAYGRSMSLFAEGATDAARRFAIEALAEDPEHEDARTLVERLGHRTWQPLPVLPQDPYSTSGPTVLRSEGDPLGTMSSTAQTVVSTGTYNADAETVLSGGASRAGEPRRSGAVRSKRYLKALQIAGLVLAVVAVAVAAALGALWFWQPGLMLSINRPEGGTLVSDLGIRCGTGGNDCTVQVAKGKVVELRPEPDDGFVFSEYTGACAPLGRITINAAAVCGATFTRIATDGPAPDRTGSVVLTVGMPTGGTIAGSGIMCGRMGNECAVEVRRGTRITLKAYVDPEFTFRGWTGDCNPKTGEVLLDASKKCGAQFARRATASNTGTAAPPPAPVPGPAVPASRSGGSVPGSSGAPALPTTPSPLGGVTPGMTPEAPPAPAPEDKLPRGPTPEDIAKQEIEQLFESFKRAWEAKEVAAIEQLYPGAPANYVRSITNQFKVYKEVEFTYTTPSDYVALSPPLGMATVKRNTLIDPKYIGPSAGQQKLENVFTLKRLNGVWRIANIVSKPGK